MTLVTFDRRLASESQVTLVKLEEEVDLLVHLLQSLRIYKLQAVPLRNDEVRTFIEQGHSQAADVLRYRLVERPRRMIGFSMSILALFSAVITFKAFKCL